MKSSGHKVAASKFATLVGLTFALALGFFVVNQGSYVTKAEGEKVLGALTSHTTTVTRTMNSVAYVCKRTNCDEVANGGGLISDDTDADSNNGNNCRAVKDSSNRSVCYWSNPIMTAAQCNVDKGVYRNRATDKGAQNLYFSEDGENIVYYNCIKITPTPTKKPSPTPTRRPSPTPTVACMRSYGQSCGVSAGQKANCRDGYVGCLSGLKCLKHVGQAKYSCQKPVIIATPTPTKASPSNAR